MAIFFNPLFSVSASGKFANTVVFGNWKGINFAREYVIPGNPSTTQQQQIRGYFKTAANAWKAENQTVKAAWTQYVKTNNLSQTGTSLYIGAYIKFLILHSGTAPTQTATPPTMS